MVHLHQMIYGLVPLKTTTHGAIGLLPFLSKQAVENGSPQQIIDARASDRFNGLAPEPRAGLRAGHIPGSLNLPINSLLDKQTGKLKTEQELQKLFDDAGFDMNLPSVTTCGSGVTAAGLTLALAILGKTDIRLFDGSWSQWGASDAPIA